MACGHSFPPPECNKFPMQAFLQSFYSTRSFFFATRADIVLGIFLNPLLAMRQLASCCIYVKNLCWGWQREICPFRPFRSIRLHTAQCLHTAAVELHTDLPACVCWLPFWTFLSERIPRDVRPHSIRSPSCTGVCSAATKRLSRSRSSYELYE